MRESLKHAKRLVVKVGSSLVTQAGTKVNEAFIEVLVGQMAKLRSRGYELLLVTSGAVAVGMGRLRWNSRPQQLHQLQAAAAIGQVQLAQCYEACFARYDWPTAQVLLTHDDLRDRTRYLNARSTLKTLLELDVLPIINENDAVASEEIRFGDNDTLAAMVTNLMESDLLVLLTDRPGMFAADPRKDPKAQLLSEVKAEDMSLEEMAGGAGSGMGKGGMITKVRAARRAARSGAHTLIAAGMEQDVLPRLLSGENLGTLFVASLPPLAARKQWLADHLSLAGILVLDDGAVAALHGGKSLLPVGVRKVQGDFQRGAVLSCQNISGQEVARGLTNYGMQELKVIASHSSHEIEKLLGYMTEAEVIHRDNLVMMN